MSGDSALCFFIMLLMILNAIWSIEKTVEELGKKQIRLMKFNLITQEAQLFWMRRIEARINKTHPMPDNFMHADLDFDDTIEFNDFRWRHFGWENETDSNKK